jgi:hypothetical protein
MIKKCALLVCAALCSVALVSFTGCDNKPKPTTPAATPPADAPATPPATPPADEKK